MTIAPSGGEAGEGGGRPSPPPSPGSPPPAASPPPQPAPLPPAATLSQADLDRARDEATRAARAAVEAELAEKLGCTPDEAAEVLKARREADEAAMTEAERIRARAEAAERKAAEVTAAAARRELEAAVTLALLGRRDGEQPAGVRPDRIDEARTLIMAGLSADADAAAVAAAVEDRAKKTPEWFGASTQTPPGIQPGTPPRNQPPQSGYDTAVQRATAEIIEASKTRRSPFDGIAVLGGRSIA